MREPIFSHITMEKKYHPHNITTKLKVCSIYEFDKPKTETQCVKLFNTKIGYREPIDEINFDYWNGCVIIDIDYKNWPNANREDSIKIMKDVYMYLQLNCNTFYYGEISGNIKGGFHFIFYLDTDYPTKERRDYLYKRSCIAIWKAFCDCGYKDIIEYEHVFDSCTNTPTQYVNMTMYGKVNSLCTGSFSGDKLKITEKLESEFNEVLKSKTKEEKVSYSKNAIKKPVDIELITKKEVSSVRYIEHAERRALFKSLSRIYSGDELREEWNRCAKLIPEKLDREIPHTTEWYMERPYKNDWNKKLNGEEWCDYELLKEFGYTIKVKNKLNKRTIKNINLLNKLHEKIK